MQYPTSLSSDPLTIYLNDHLGGATFGLELARRARAANRGNEFGAFLDDLSVAIEEDRRELERIIERLGRPRDQLKSAVGWLTEKAGRLKPIGRLVGYSPLSRLLEIEGLNGGVQAKLTLWRALRAAAPSEPRLDERELDTLIGRAQAQLEGIASMHARAAELALADAGPGAAHSM